MSLRSAVAVLVIPFLLTACRTASHQGPGHGPATRTLRPASTHPSRAPLALRTPLQDKSYYALSAILNAPALRAQLAASPELINIARRKRADLRTLAEKSPADISSATAPLKLTDEETQAIVAALRGVLQADRARWTTCLNHLRTTGLYLRHNALPDADFLAAVWLDSAKALNAILDTYGAAKRPAYPLIDSLTYDLASPKYKSLISQAADVARFECSESDLAFEPTLRFAMTLLYVNHRDEAARFEPLDTGANRDALARIPSIRFSDYPYTTLLVPGIGGDDLTEHLTSGGKMNIAIAAQAFRDKKAPLIIVSGGYVHPNQTPYCEAVEMRRALIDDFGIPANAILIDPHARHTTTNLRNASRLIYRYGIPLDKPALVTCSRRAAAGIASKKFADRCTRELGYVPMRIGNRISPLEVEFFALPDSLQADPIAPLDP